MLLFPARAALVLCDFLFRREIGTTTGFGEMEQSSLKEAGNILAKQLTFLANADSAGLVLGARVPIVLTSRADSVRARTASCAVAMLAAHARRQALTAATA